MSYKTHKELPQTFGDNLLCTTNYNPEVWKMDNWLMSEKDEEVTCKHCLKLLKTNPLAKRLSERHKLSFN